MKLILLFLIFTTLWTIQAQILNQPSFNYVPLSVDNAVLLFVDQQTGLANGIKDHKTLVDWRNSLLALAKIGKYFNLPTVITSSVVNGPNGPIYPDLLNLLPNATVINRLGEINAMDNSDFAGFVNSTGRRKFIVSGIVTEVCVAFVALSLLDKGFDVYVAFDSSGTYDKFAEDIAIQRLVHKGVVPMTWFAIASELQKDWRNQITASYFTQILKDHLPWYSNLILSFNNNQQSSSSISSSYSNTASYSSSESYTQASSQPYSSSETKTKASSQPYSSSESYTQESSQPYSSSESYTQESSQPYSRPTSEQQSQMGTGS